MFTQQLPPELFQLQREFIRVMDANRDFVWWADTLIVEETKELRDEFEADVTDMNKLFKELADLLYVVAGFYNVMPTFAPEVVDQETNERMQRILDEAAVLVSEVSQKLQIPLPIILAAFKVVHDSNMSKVNPETGKPDRREDGKILKGPNYTAPSMDAVVSEWDKYRKNSKAKETIANAG
ncbi:nucleoside triphosphate pyrophosphohydrolase [Roseobacter phage RD-1410Ws-07]|uniref:Nucleoside triphosphate pyrophosphohydrolase n=1 Tax=Roseobacter phage RD-1410Ws-07 TaxID=1815985 RepID=A0A191VYP7_9CAUD|nr:nucleoside triphosphate pyrophosphohydrolase [Roseobacter phage RD-1410Ws-07]